MIFSLMNWPKVIARRLKADEVIFIRSLITVQQFFKWDCYALWVRTLKDDVVILRKCPWGAMTVSLGFGCMRKRCKCSHEQATIVHLKDDIKDNVS